MMNASSTRRIGFLVLGIAVSAVLLWLAVRDADIDEIAAALAAAELLWSLPFLFCLFAYYWLKSVRWADLLGAARPLTGRQLFPIVMIGYAGTAVLPMQLGEVVRAYLAGKQLDLKITTTIASIGVEKIIDLLTVMGLMGIILAIGQDMPETMITAGYVIAGVTFTGVLLLAIVLFSTGSSMRIAAAVSRLLPDRLGTLFEEQANSAIVGFQAIREWPVLLRVSIQSIAQWALMGVCILLSLVALDIQVPPTGVALVLVATVVTVSLPASPGYVGNIQFAFAIALQPFGVSPSEAFAASVFYHVLAYCSVVVVGFFYLHAFGYGFGTIRSDATDQADT